MSKSILKKILNVSTVLGAAILISGCDNIPPTSAIDAETKIENFTQTPSFSQPYRKFLEQRIEAGTGVGLAISLVDNNKQDYIFAGVADQNTQQTINQDSLFEIGSITKTFTAILLADMVLRGEVSLDDPAARYLPESVTMPNDSGRVITLKDLATHSSGLPRIPDNLSPADPQNPYADYTPEEMYAFLSSFKLEREIGEEITYSNLGIGLLGHILERRTGLSYEQLVTQRILEPLSMSNTFIAVPEDKKAKFIFGHDAAGKRASYWEIPALAGAGALRSSLQDMTIYLKANMGLIDTPLDEAIAMSHKIQLSLDDEDEFIGLAWFTQKKEAQKITWHNGGTGGFRTFLGFDQKNKRGVIVLANAQGEDSDLIGKAILTMKPELLEPKTVNPDVSFTSQELEAFVGEYQLAPNFSIFITHDNSRLFLQATGQGKAEIYAKSRLEFFLKVVDASIIFKENDEGEITSLVLNQGGVMQTAKKL